MAKFKVGDKIKYQFKTGPPIKFDIVEVHGSTYGIQGKNINDYGRPTIDHMDKYSELYEYKVADTEIARKLYTGRIEKEKDGYLWIKV